MGCSVVEQEELKNYIEALEGRQKDLNSRNIELADTLSASSFGNTDDKTLIHYQLEADNLKMLVQRQLRGDTPKMDEAGNVIYIKQTNRDLIPLNELGVAQVMITLSMYIDKNTFLSNLDLPRMYELLFSLGSNLNDFFYINLSAIGLDTPEKQSKYPLIIKSILDVCEFSLRRAIDGQEAKNMNTRNISVNQGNNNGGNQNQMMSPQKIQKFNLFSPSSW